MKQLLNLDFLDPQRILIPTSTGECPSNVEILYTVEELKKYDPELYNEFLYDLVQAVYTTTVEKAPQVFESLLYKLVKILHSDYISEEELRYIIPDIFNQMQHLAFVYNYLTKTNLLPIDYVFSLIKNFDERSKEQEIFPNERLQDYVHFFSGELSYIIGRDQSLLYLIGKKRVRIK
jgi:hypothetical protein